MGLDAELPPRAGSVTIELESAGRRVLRLSGTVDTAVATRFAAGQRRDQVVVDAIDAGGVTFISSSGLAIMVMCVEASVAAGRKSVLRAVSPQVARALQLAGITSLFPRPGSGDGAVLAADGF